MFSSEALQGTTCALTLALARHPAPQSRIGSYRSKNIFIQITRSAIVSQGAMAPWCAVKGPQVCWSKAVENLAESKQSRARLRTFQFALLSKEPVLSSVFKQHIYFLLGNFRIILEQEAVLSHTNQYCEP